MRPLHPTAEFDHHVFDHDLTTMCLTTMCLTTMCLTTVFDHRVLTALRRDFCKDDDYIGAARVPLAPRAPRRADAAAGGGGGARWRELVLPVAPGPAPPPRTRGPTTFDHLVKILF
jgi:hypothetical protein